MSADRYTYIALLKTAVKGVHVYRNIPKQGTNVEIKHDSDSAEKHSVGVYHKGNTLLLYE